MRIFFLSVLALVLVNPDRVNGQAHQPDVDNKVVYHENTGGISVNFSGGSLGDYIDMLNKAAKSTNAAAEDGETPFDMSNVVNRDAASFMLPDIVLTNVEPVLALQLLEGMHSGDRQLQLRGEDGVFVVSSRKLDVEETTMVQVFNVSQLLKHIDEKEFLSAIELGLGMLDRSEKTVKMKLHKETGLMFVKGSHDQVELIHETVEQLGVSSRANLQNQMLEQFQNMQNGRSGGGGGLFGPGGGNRGRKSEDKKSNGPAGAGSAAPDGGTNDEGTSGRGTNFNTDTEKTYNVNDNATSDEKDNSKSNR